MARLYGNENFPLPVVEALRDLGHDVLTIHETGRGGEAIPDAKVLKFATAEQRAVITLNRKDFIKLHLISSDHAGIVVCTFDPNFSGQAERIHRTLTAEGELNGKLLRVNRPACCL
jgi:hypothetical protein